MKNPLCAILVGFAILLLGAGNSLAVAISSTASGGNWNSTSTWTPAQVPTSADNVTIAAGAPVTVTADAAANWVTIAQFIGVATPLTINSGFTLTVTAGFTNSAPKTGNDISKVQVNGTLTVGGSFDSQGTTSGGNKSTTLAFGASGVCTISGIYVVGGAGNTDMSAGGTLNLAASGTAWPLSPGGTFLPGTGTVNYSGTSAQTVSALTYANLTLSGGSLKTFSSTATVITNTLEIIVGTTANLNYSGSINVTNLVLDDNQQTTGTYGSTSSAATYKDATFFPQTTTGILNVNSVNVSQFSNLTASQAITYGTASITLTGIVSSTSGVLAKNNKIVFVTINGNQQQTTIQGGAGGFTINYNCSTIPYSAAPYTITYRYRGDHNLTPATNTSTTLTVNKANATFTVTPYTVTYDGNPHTATVSTITGVNGETGATVGTVTLSTTHTAAGTYSSDSWSFTGTANYNNIGSTTITDTINQRALTFTGSKIYDGNASATAAQLTFGNNVDGANLTKSGSVTLASANVGTPSISSFGGLTLGGSAAGNYTLTGASGTVTITLRTVSYARGRNVPLRITISALLSAATDNSGVGLTLAGVTTPSTGGGATVQANATYILYTPTTVGNVGDSFTYAVNPGGGSGTVNVTIAPDPTGTNYNFVSYGLDVNSKPTMIIAGVPGSNYVVQVTSDLTGTPTWADKLTTNAPSGGLFQFTDTSPPNPAFYRAINQ